MLSNSSWAAICRAILPITVLNIDATTTSMCSSGEYACYCMVLLPIAGRQEDKAILRATPWKMQAVAIHNSSIAVRATKRYITFPSHVSIIDTVVRRARGMWASKLHGKASLPFCSTTICDPPMSRRVQERKPRSHVPGAMCSFLQALWSNKPRPCPHLSEV